MLDGPTQNSLKRDEREHQVATEKRQREERIHVSRTEGNCDLSRY